MNANFCDWPSADCWMRDSNCLPFLATKRAVLSTMTRMSGGGRITPVTSPDVGAASPRALAGVSISMAAMVRSGVGSRLASPGAVARTPRPAGGARGLSAAFAGVCRGASPRPGAARRRADQRLLVPSRGLVARARLSALVWRGSAARRSWREVLLPPSRRAGALALAATTSPHHREQRCSFLVAPWPHKLPSELDFCARRLFRGFSTGSWLRPPRSISPRRESGLSGEIGSGQVRSAARLGTQREELGRPSRRASAGPATVQGVARHSRGRTRSA